MRGEHRGGTALEGATEGPPPVFLLSSGRHTSREASPKHPALGGLHPFGCPEEGKDRSDREASWKEAKGARRGPLPLPCKRRLMDSCARRSGPPRECRGTLRGGPGAGDYIPLPLGPPHPLTPLP